MLVPRFFCSFFFDDDGDGGAGDAGGVADCASGWAGQPQSADLLVRSQQRHTGTQPPHFYPPPPRPDKLRSFDRPADEATCTMHAPLHSHAICYKGNVRPCQRGHARTHGDANHRWMMMTDHRNARRRTIHARSATERTHQINQVTQINQATQTGARTHARTYLYVVGWW